MTLFVDAATIARTLTFTAAADALESALRAGLDPEADPARSSVETTGGQLLLMPAASAEFAGVKLVSIAPGNARLGLPRIQAVYVLFDAATLTPLATLDGTALTVLRTAAVSALAARHLAPPNADRLVVFGLGPQAAAHIAALRAERPISQVTVVHPDATRAASFAALHQAQAGTPTAVADAAIVACCTTAREPLFDGTHLRAGACVIAIGSHEPTAREVDDAVVRTAAIVVEARSAALREAGDLVIPLHRGGITPESLADLGQLVRGEVTVAPERQRFFKSVGMGWEDLVVAGAVYQALTA